MRVCVRVCNSVIDIFVRDPVETVGIVVVVVVVGSGARRDGGAIIALTAGI